MPHRRITREEVERVAQLAHLRFSPDEIDSFTEGFDRIIAYVEKLGEVDTEGVEPMTRTTTDVTPPPSRRGRTDARSGRGAEECAEEDRGILPGAEGDRRDRAVGRSRLVR